MSDGSSKSNLFEKLVPVLLLVSFGLVFGLGYLFNEVKTLKKGGVTTPTGNQAAAPAATVDIATVKGLFDKDIIKFGDKDKKVLFVEIADPSCPYCHVADGQNPEIGAQIGDQFKYISDGGTYVPPVTEMRKLVDEGKASYAFIYFPGHGSGEMATKALYCANDQGKYWEAHDLLYTNSGYSLINDTVKNDKAQTGKLLDFLKSAVDTKALASCLDSGKYDARITEDQNLASTLGVSGTPGFFINDKRFDGAYSWADMKATVDAALK